MILSRKHIIELEGFAKPAVGVTPAARHLKVHHDLFKRFTESISGFWASPQDLRLAVSAEVSAITLMTYKNAMAKTTEEYRVTAGLKQGITCSDVLIALDYGILETSRRCTSRCGRSTGWSILVIRQQPGTSRRFSIPSIRTWR
jgi:hypothetical protein